jgi:glucokinase
MRIAAVTNEGRLASEVISSPTGPSLGPDELRAALRELVARVQAGLGAAEVAGVGLGIAGVVGDGPLSQCDNLPRLEGVDIAALVREAVEAPALVENDARCFALAEARFGAGRGARHVCGITLGTGVGCGLIVDGRLHRGALHQAGEVWSIPVRGKHLEYFLSGAGVVRGYREAGGGGLDAGLDAAEIEQRGRRGDAAALAAWRAFGEDLAFLCHTALAFLDPAVIVIGGSLARARDLYAPVLTARLQGRVQRLADAQLGAAAGVVGAAALTMPPPDEAPVRPA